MSDRMRFLPVSRADMEARGINQLDFVYVIGDAYVDHPSFGPAIISRLLESHGYQVGIIAQPDFRHAESIMALGEPRLGFLVSAGNMDSMVNHYSVAKKHRKVDSYTPGGEMGKRPDRAVIVYCNLIRQKYKHVPIIAGGIEASLRRMAHYDYWSDSLRRSILLESGADLVSYGMGERSIVAIADALDAGMPVKDITYIPGTVCKVRSLDEISDYTVLPDYESICKDKKKYAESFYIQYSNTDPFSGKRLVEPYSQNCFIVQNPASEPLTMEEMDQVYDLPFQRTWHPMYDAAGGIPALSEVKFSLVSCRGCFGGCSFCALTFHQGRIIQARSHESLIKEAKLMIEEPDFKGYIHDVGGPTADFRAPACEKQMTKGVCPHKQCLFPEPCKNLRADHSDYIALLRKLRALPKVKKVFIRSGIRFDYVLADKKSTFLEELCRYHVSGQLKVAPEHVSDPVLACLGKPKAAVYQEFCRQYKKMNERLGLKQYLVPYLMSSHPGSTMKEAVELAEYCRDLGYMPEQVQDFYPTPSTISTCMYYTGLDPRTMTAVYVPKDPHEKEMQRALIQYRNPANRVLVREALLKAGREDLIGYGPKCLLRPDQARGDGRAAHRDDNRRVEKRSAGRGRGASSGRTADRNNTQSRSQNQEQTQERRPTQKKKTIRNVHRKK
ncbi:YgiQ family radical SAM protein [Clostridiaceae bacterium AM27-36LB]|nr:YgiQ family radical SAM protein [Clostridiales bacterium AM23-16LB]RHR45310.1 YgiQ family radical SAM protein [Clostridiaceae bacterium AF18-31LB]RHT83809.1 YgiQ family radical SAM protein [Clostridiaceae bacterium AM27-36LB]